MTARPSPAVFTLHGALLRAAEAHPDRAAVSDSAATLTYAELARRSGQAAAALRELGVEPGDRVAVSAEKQVSTVAALYGILRAGAAYVPVDPLFPPRRAAAVIADAGCRALFADRTRAERLAPEVGIPVVGIGPAVEGAAATAGQVESLEPDDALQGCESDLAYLLYTSGSTGVPKGVMLTHRNALAFVEWAVGRFGIRAEDRLASHAPFHFDLSVLDLYGAALAGAAVHLLSPEEAAFGASLAAAVRSRAVTVWYSVPRALVLLCDAAEATDVETLRVVLFAGEVFPVKHLRRLRALVPNAVLANLYGPTETNVCTYFAVDDAALASDEGIPIGRACENQEVFALDDHRRPVAPGATGELWVRGPTVMKGYWGDPERTAQSLGQDPRHDRFPDPAYRTGDLVRQRSDGNYELLGRRDHQVKTRGYRVELGEVESVLVGHPAVAEAAVVAVPDERFGNLLVAYVAGADVDATGLKRHCAERLPRYMVPATVHVEEALPHTSTGKIDRQALAQRASVSGRAGPPGE